MIRIWIGIITIGLGAGALAEDAHETNAPLTLATAIEIALTNNPEASAAQWDVRESEARATLARSGRLPVLKAQGGYDYYTEHQRLAQANYNGEQGVFGANPLRADLVLSLLLYTGGRVTSEIRASDLIRQAAEGQLTRTRETIVFNVTSLFYGLLSQDQIISSFESAARAMEEQKRNIEAMILAQKAARVDLLRADVRLAELREKLTRENNALTVQRQALTVLLGWDAPDAPRVAGELSINDPPISADAASCLKKALARRSDYAAARQKAAAHEQGVSAARSGYLPTFSIDAGYGGRWMVTPADYPEGTEDLRDLGSVGVRMDWSIFDGWATTARVREQTAKLNAAREQLRKLELYVRYDVETALANIVSARERVKTTAKSVEQAQESFRIMREKYDLGKGAMTDVLDAQAALVLEESSRSRALADLAVAHAQLKLATGEIMP
jgi:outer membrane protein TolC